MWLMQETADDKDGDGDEEEEESSDADEEGEEEEDAEPAALAENKPNVQGPLANVPFKMESWKQRVHDALRRNHHVTLLLMETIQRDLHNVLTHARCRNCGREALQLDIVPLPCGHDQCQDCLNSLLTTQTEYFRKTMSPAAFDRLGLLRGTVLCSKCQGPFVLQRKTVFDERKQLLDSRKLVCLRALSDAMRSFCHPLEVYENQRRTMFSRYSPKNLLLTDFRGQWSSVDGDTMGPPEEMTLPGPSCVWAHDWIVTFEGENVDCDGWSYAFNWPSTGILSWTLALKWYDYSGATMWVRRRRHYRVYFDFSDEVATFLNRVDEDSSGPLPEITMAVFVK